MEAIVHINTLITFHNIWSNPDTTVFKIVKNILTMCMTNSTTWSNHLRLLCLKYGLPSPLSLLQTHPWPKKSWKCLIKTKITQWYEADLRNQALNNSKMRYHNVKLSGLSGTPHPAIMNINTKQDVKRLRYHIKFLTCDYLTNERLSMDQPHLNPACVLCGAPLDSLEHVLVACRATQECRSRLLPELLNTVAAVQPMCAILQSYSLPDILTQFILDCTSLNLPENYRIPAHNPDIPAIFKVSRDWTYGIGSERLRLLKLTKRKF